MLSEPEVADMTQETNMANPADSHQASSLSTNDGKLTQIPRTLILVCIKRRRIMISVFTKGLVTPEAEAKTYTLAPPGHWNQV